MDAHRLTIIVPAFNEEKAISKVLQDLREAAGLQGAEIILIDDGSADQTAERASAVSGVRVLKHRHNIGYGGAIKTGVRASRREYVCWYDGDGQHRPCDLVRLVDEVQREDADWGIGVRGENSHIQLSRLPGKWLLRTVVRISAGNKRVPDFNSGLRVFRAKQLRIYLHLLPNGFSASTTTTLLMLERGYRLVEVPIETQERIGSSEVRQLRDGTKTLMLILRIFLLFKAMAFFFAIGSGILFAGALYSAIVMYMNRLGVPIAGLLVMMTGLLTIFMGLIADQLSLIRRERFEDIDYSSHSENS
jgi:glycosyltransferase involved in cell wall biosynthesis